RPARHRPCQFRWSRRPESPIMNDGRGSVSLPTTWGAGGSMREGPTRDDDYVAFDLETTGLMAETDRVVEVGAVRFDASGNERGGFERLVSAGRPRAPAAQKVHGLSDAALADAEPARAVLPEFLAFLGDPATTTLLAHNASFDAGFLGRELGRLDLPL